MKVESARMSAVIPASAREIYDAWLSGKGHAAMTGSPAKGSAKVTLKHTEIPAGQADGYREGWTEYYFAPMKEHFSKKTPKMR